MIRYLLLALSVSLLCLQPVAAAFTAGAAKVDITPDYPVRLNGYLARKAESTGVAQHIYAKALAFGADGADVAVLISVDNCILPARVREELVRRLKGRGVRPERLAINTSHTHAAPKLAGAADNIFGHDIAPEEQAHIDRYTREFIDCLEKAAVTALENRGPATLAWGQTKATFANNRRVKNGPVDHDLPVLVVENSRGEIQALVTSYACHCTTLGPEPNEISGDWAGYAQEYLETAHPGAIALTLVGCGAEANPEPRGTVELAQKHGHSIADAVDARLAQPLTPLTAPLVCHTEKIALPFDTLPTREEWQARAAKNDPPGYHARKNLARLDRGEALPRDRARWCRTTPCA